MSDDKLFQSRGAATANVLLPTLPYGFSYKAFSAGPG